MPANPPVLLFLFRFRSCAFAVFSLVSAPSSLAGSNRDSGSCFFSVASWYGGGAKEDPLASIRGWAGASRNERYVGSRMKDGLCLVLLPLALTNTYLTAQEP